MGRAARQGPDRAASARARDGGGLVGRDEELAVLKQTFQRVQSDRRPALVTVVGPAGVGQVAPHRRVRALRRGPAGHRLLAARPLSRVRQHLVLRARGCDQGAVRDLRRRRRRGRGEEGGRRRRELFGDDEIAPQLRALVGAGESARPSREDCSRPGAGSSNVSPRGTRSCSCSTTSTGPTTGCSTSSSTSPTGRRGRSWSSRLRAPSCSRRVRRGAAASGTRPRSSSTRCPRTEGAAMLDDLLPGPMRPELERAVVERSEGNPLYVEEIVRKLIDDGVLRATEASRWEVARPIAEVELPRSVRGSSPRAWMASRRTRSRCSRMRRSSVACSGWARSPRSPAERRGDPRRARQAPREGAVSPHDRPRSRTSTSSRSATP